MIKKTLKFFALMFILLVFVETVSAVIVDTDYMTVYPGEEGMIKITVDNNENFAPYALFTRAAKFWRCIACLSYLAITRQES